MDNISISVVMPVYNTGKILQKTIDSVLTQTQTDFELIIIDDGSQCETSKIAQRYSDPRIQYHYQENRGMAAARNRGIELARGKYIAFLDHDDIWLPEKLEQQLEVFKKNPDIVLVYSPVIFFKENVAEFSRPLPLFKGDVLPILASRNIIRSASCVMIRVDILKSHNFRFRSECVPCDDYDLWIRLAMAGPFDHTKKPLVKYRLHSNNVSKNHNKMQLAHSHSLKMLLPYILRYPNYSIRKKFSVSFRILRSISWLYRRRAIKYMRNPQTANSALRNATMSIAYGWFNPKNIFIFIKTLQFLMTCKLKRWFQTL